MNEVAQSPQASLEAHYTNDIKVRRPKLTEASAPNSLPSRVLFSDREATKKMQSINTDIYEGTKKEKQKNEFNKSLYFKILAVFCLQPQPLPVYVNSYISLENLN